MAKDRPVKVETKIASRELADNTFNPLVDIYETPAELVVVAEMPGAAREDISVRVDKGVLTVEGEAAFDVPADPFGETYVGFEPGTYFRREFALSDEIDRDKISASVANGVLTVRLPKSESGQSRKIEIKTPD